MVWSCTTYAKGITHAHSQVSQIILTGKVVDEMTQIPLEYATVSLFSRKDSMLLYGVISNAEGHFSLRTEHQDFFVKLEFIAYQPKIIEDIQKPGGNGLLDLGIITLAPDTEMLGEIEVIEEKSTVMMSLDKRVFNVGQDLTSQGGTAEDVLKNVPGVWVDINGEVSLRGSGNARILVDGQTSLLINGKNSDGLRQIQASSIERIEIITNPSARYEAEGMAGIINIVMKKEDAVGLNGSVNGNIGYPDNFGVGLSMNYRRKKWNVFSALGIWYVKRPGWGKYRNFLPNENPDSILYSYMDRTHERQGTPINFKLGGDYFINSQNTLTTSLYYRINDDSNQSRLIYRDAYGNISNLHQRTERKENENGNEHNLNAFLRHRKIFGHKEHHLTSEVRYEQEQESEVSKYDENYFDRNDTPLDTLEFHQITRNKADNSLFLAKADYVLPLRKGRMFEAGFQSTFRNITDDYQTSELQENVEVPDPNFTNNFNYAEAIHGIYSDFGDQIGAFSYQVGLRVEYSDVESALDTDTDGNQQRYFSYFPSAFLSYAIKKHGGVQLSYSRRIERPTFLDLTPFFTLRDRRNIWRGNPNIRPEFTHAVELGYIRYWDKATISAIAYYRRTTDVIKRIQRVYVDEAPDVTVTQTENLDLKRNYGIELTYNLRLLDWWRLNGDINFFHSFSGGTYEDRGEEIYVGGESFSLQSKAISRFTFWDKWNTQLTLNYSAPRTTTQGVNRSTFAMDFATSLDVLKNKATITFGINDIFNSNRRRSYSENDTFFSEDDFLWQERSFLLSFNYRINQHKKQNQIYSSPVKEDKEERF